MTGREAGAPAPRKMEPGLWRERSGATFCGMLTRRSFLRSVSAAAAGLPLLRARGAETAAAPLLSSFFLVGDTHYRADQEQPAAMYPASTAVNARLIDWLNRLPGTDWPETVGAGTVPRPDGVIHAGDLIDSGDKTGPLYTRMAETELSAFLADWGLNGIEGRLRWPVREVHGNHDSPHGGGPVIAEIIARNKRRTGLSAVSDNGLHYAWNWGGVHFAALGIVVGDAPEVTRKRRYAPLGSLGFLRQDLAARKRGDESPLVLVHHVDVARYSTVVSDEIAARAEWDYGDVQAFHETIRPHRIAATVYGHTHARNLFRWNGTKDMAAKQGIASLNTDNAAHFHGQTQAFLHVEVTAAGTTVREFATANAWETGAWTPQVWRFG